MATNYLKGEPLELRWRSSWCEHQARAIPSLFQSQADTLGDTTLYLVKRDGVYQPVSWQTGPTRCGDAAAALIARGVQPGDRVAILSENRYEWVVADLAILHAGAASRPCTFPLPPNRSRSNCAIRNRARFSCPPPSRRRKSRRSANACPPSSTISVLTPSAAGRPRAAAAGRRTAPARQAHPRA